MLNEQQPPQLNQVLDKIRQINPYLQRQWGVTVLAVFGSVARGEATPESDIDVMFDYDHPLGWELSSLGDYLEETLGRKVDMLSKKAIRPKVWPYIKEDMRYV